MFVVITVAVIINFPLKCVRLTDKSEFCLYTKEDDSVEGLFLSETKAVCLHLSYH